MKINAKISISRSSVNGEPMVRIVVKDEMSHIEFLELEVQPEEFGLAVTGLSYQPCSGELRGLDKVGKRYEYKTERVEFSSGRYGAVREDAAREAVKPLEVDGWQGEWRDLLNHHKRIGPDVYGVTFVRWVDVKENEQC